MDILHLLCCLYDLDADFHQAGYERRHDDDLQAFHLDFYYAHRGHFCLHDLQACCNYNCQHDHHYGYWYVRLFTLPFHELTISPVTSTKTSTSVVTSPTILTRQSTSYTTICKTVPVLTPIEATEYVTKTQTLPYVTPCTGK